MSALDFLTDGKGEKRPRQFCRGPFCRSAGDRLVGHRTDLALLDALLDDLWAMFFGTGSYCLKIIVKEPRPWVTVRIAFE